MQARRSDRDAATQGLSSSFSPTRRQKQAEKRSILSLGWADAGVQPTPVSPGGEAAPAQICALLKCGSGRM